MGDHQQDLGWRPPVIFALVAVAAAVAYALWPNWQGYCPASEVLAECFRQWLSALSGWAAALAAGLTILFLQRESVKRDVLDWRDICNSAELLRGTLEPQVQSLQVAIKEIDKSRTTAWLSDCLDKIERAISDPTNQDFRRASVVAAARVRTCVRFVEYAKVAVAGARANNTVIDSSGQQIVTLAFAELRDFLGELQRIRDSALDPKKYRGV